MNWMKINDLGQRVLAILFVVFALLRILHFISLPVFLWSAVLLLVTSTLSSQHTVRLLRKELKIIRENRGNQKN